MVWPRNSRTDNNIKTTYLRNSNESAGGVVVVAVSWAGDHRGRCLVSIVVFTFNWKCSL